MHTIAAICQVLLPTTKPSINNLNSIMPKKKAVAKMKHQACFRLL